MVTTLEREATTEVSAPSVARRGLIRSRFAYRRGQGLLLAALAALMMIAIVGAPLYERLVEQESMRSTLVAADTVSRGISVAVALDTPAATVDVPNGAQRWFRVGVTSISAPALIDTPQYLGTSASVTYRDDQCQHLSFDSGQCPTTSGVAVSSSLAAAAGLHVGDEVQLNPPVAPETDSAATVKVKVVGLYRPFNSDDDYWFGHNYSTSTGISVYPGGDDFAIADTMFASEATVNAVAVKSLLTDITRPSIRETDYALIPDATGVDDIASLRGLATSLPAGTGITSTTQLTSYLDQIDNDRRDVLRVVTVTAAQLALLAAIAFGVLVVAAADQRKQEFALARLRGRSPAQSTGVFTRELALFVVVAAVPGAGLAWLAVWLAGRFMSSPVTPEVRWPVVAALVLAVVVAIVIVVSVGARQSRLPVGDLLREVAPMRSRRGVGVLEVAVAVLALAGLATAYQGGRDSALGTLTPTFLAVLIAMVVVRVTLVVARRRAQRSLRRGSLVNALAAFSVARRPGGRLLVTLICLATALAVFTAQQWSIASAARWQRAQVVVGAPAVLQVNGPTFTAVDAAVRSVDPQSSWATTTVRVTPTNTVTPPLLAVDPGPFARIAAWGRDELRPSPGQIAALTPKVTVPPITITGDTARLSLTDVSWVAVPLADVPPSTTPEIYVRLTFFHDDGRTTTADLGPLPTNASQLDLSTPVACDDGCRLISLNIQRPKAGDSEPVQVQFGVNGVGGTSGAGGAPATGGVGTASQWQSLTPVNEIIGTTLAEQVVLTDQNGVLHFRADDDGNQSIAQYLNQPLAIPALVAGDSATKPDAAFETPGPYGANVGLTAVGSIPFAPLVGAPMYLSNLNLLKNGAPESGTTLTSTASVAVWSRYSDKAHVDQLTAALAKQKVTVASTTFATDERDQLASTGPALSADLALVVGVIAELLALGLLLLIVVTSRRPRQRDLAALRLLGLPRSAARRATTAELLALVFLGLIAGTAAGVAGTIVAVPGVPIFGNPSKVPIPTAYDLQIWWLVGTVVLGVLILTTGAWVMAGRLARRRPKTTHQDANQ